MARLVHFMIALATVALPAPLAAQDDGGTFLEGLIEDRLSTDGTQVRVEGFAGVLSSEATLEKLTIADARGVWFTMRDARLQWTRSALLQGRLEVAELSAERIDMPRLPRAKAGLAPEDSAARGFSLPDLPVSVEIGKLRAGRVTLGAPVLGQAVALSADGSLTLAGGAGEAALTVTRRDAEARLEFEGSYADATRQLAVDLEVEEAENGLLGTLLALPGTPALSFRAEGAGPLSDFTADVALATDGAPRLSGQVRLFTTGDEGPAQAFAANLTGDMRPLFPEELRPFFGGQTRLAVDGRTGGETGLQLSRFEAQSAAMELSGTLDLGPAGWPRAFDVSGQIDGEGSVRLPLAGAATRVDTARLSARFDAARGEAWQADLTVTGLERTGTLQLEEMRLTGRGTMRRRDGGTVNGTLLAKTAGLALTDAALQRAVGTAPSGRLTFGYRPQAPLRVDTLVAESAGARLTAEGEIGALADGVPVSGSAQLQAADLSRFAALAGRDLAGHGTAQVDGRGTLLGGDFDAQVSARTEALHTGAPRLDPLLATPTDVSLSAARDTTGTRIRSLTLSNRDVTATASGQLTPKEGTLDLSARIREIARAEPRLEGTATLDAGIAWTDGGPLRAQDFTVTLGAARMRGSGQITPGDPALPLDGRVTVDIPRLSTFARLADRPLAGRLELSAQAAGALRKGDLTVTADVTGTELSTGIPTLDPVVDGRLIMSGEVARRDGALDIRELAMETPRLVANAKGQAPGKPVRLSARLADLGLIAPGLSGPLTVDGDLRPTDIARGRWEVSLRADGPGGARARVSGDLADYGRELGLVLRGSAPLGLANNFIAPRSLQGTAEFDLRVNGRPRLSSVSGQARLPGARAALPALNTAVTGITGTVRLGGGRADVDLNGAVRAGGRLGLTGSVALDPPFRADLRLPLTGVTLRDPGVFGTRANGRVAVEGPLAGGALISGRLDLVETEIQVAPTGAGTGLEPSRVDHLNAPADVRATRRRAGLTGRGASGTGGPSYPLDLLVRAPNRVFVRGRGLDAELGGNLRLGGTTANVAPSGTVELIRGRLDILGRRLDLTEGRVTMRGSFDPALRFVAETRANDITARVIVEGLASSPDITFTSQPELPQEEVLAQMLFGRDLGSISPFQAAQLASAVATLSGRGGAGIIGNLRQATGLSDLDVTTGEAGNTQLRFGKYLTENIYSEVTTDSGGKQQIELNLDVSTSVTVKGRADTEGGTGLGVFYERDY
ncbi:translocation/assembly module TamB domain-containing protein [Roseovarius salinarum]|uniref:translocation/assembly module TamB domain-containing protein n=1 Tax=Roseovarius salinarum TaxID=1981892 RepID=UPI000C33A77E|nr:translocation/assembly module TamB domain-containing protein [Roseovarius salinarum]